MPLALGIDTGGTYTDCVLLDLDTREVLSKAKSFTTVTDLSLGIRNSIENMDSPRLNEVILVALSTTLATNAIIEERGCRVGLLLIGCAETGTWPTRQVATISGGHDIQGRQAAELDMASLTRAISTMRDKVDTVAISAYLSIRNPDHELKALHAVKKLCKLPVVCAHQLTAELGFRERTLTACLNARLVPIITELLAAVRSVLADKRIRAPLMVVKGDGSLMNEETACEKPIQTVLSGPAASIIGARFLSGSERALILDMGGTTTDITILEKGRPRVKREGATVGGWKVRVESAEISTFGLGGDSYIQVSRERKLSIGPKRVWSLAATADRYPQLLDELEGLTAKSEVAGYQPVDCWMLLKKPGSFIASQRESDVIEALQDGAHNLFVLADRVGCHPDLLPLAGLEQAQVIARISLTPTDLLHASGKFTRWNVAAAVAAVGLQARRMHMDQADFLDLALHKVRNALSRSILQSLLHRQNLAVELGNDPGADAFVDRFFAGQAHGGLGVELRLEYPVVAVGAPVAAYLPAVARDLQTWAVIPEHAEVANAVGAAVGQVVHTIPVLIKPAAEGGFVVHAPWEREAFRHLADAEAYAVAQAEMVALQSAQRAGAHHPRIILAKEEVVAPATDRDDHLFLEMRIEVTAVGRPYGEGQPG